jgi:A/G-specific adenine glycosylase
MHGPAISSAARAAILTWYDARGRALPFRGDGDPYAILVSEVMAQQTQISRVSAHWSTFMATFPTVERLATAPTSDVLRAWRGLGYNRRALNLQRAARTIVSEHGGRMPREVAAMQRMPGIGPYTARAVAALAFGQAVGPVDTNVRRVLGRLIGSSATGVGLQRIADAIVPADRPADWTHALMDLGATVCRPAAPRCAECPVSPWCRSLASRGRRRKPRPGMPAPAFATTSRWLRGRILDQLRDVPGATWGSVMAPVGDHDGDAVEAALRAMEADGMIERHSADRSRARLAR